MSEKVETYHEESAPSAAHGTSTHEIPPMNLAVKAESLLLRKLDFVLLPVIFFTMSLQYIDKVILNGTAQFGIIEDLNLFEIVGSGEKASPIISLRRFSNATLIFYWGFLAGTIPAAVLCQKLPIGKFLGTTVIIWGVITTLTVTVNNYVPMLVLRFFLGLSEAAVGPGISIMITMFWKRQEQPLRYSIWYTSTGLGGFIGSILQYGMGHIRGSLRQWQYPFLILGSVTIGWGFFLVWFLPDEPKSAKFLSTQEKLLATERLRSEETAIQDRAFKWSQAVETVTDPKTWLILIMSFCLHFVNGAISGFGTIIVRAFGFSPLDSVLLTGAVGAMVFLVLVVIGVAAARIKNSRLVFYSACEIPVIIGAALVWKMPWETSRGAAVSGFVMLGFFAACYTMLLATVGANTAGHTKKVLTQAIIWSTYGICNGVSPLFVKQTEVDQQYPSMFLGVIVTASISCLGGMVMRFYLQYLNTRRERLRNTSTIQAQDVSGLDKTDMENIAFRYVL